MGKKIKWMAQHGGREVDERKSKTKLLKMIEILRH